MLDTENPHFAFFTVPDAMGMKTTDGTIIYDNQAQRQVYTEGNATPQLLLQAKAYLQKLYDVIDGL